MSSFRKLLRFIIIYGFRRALVKAMGRLRTRIPIVFIVAPWRLLGKQKKCIAIVGCGQFSYATIGYFVCKNVGEKFKYCYDINKNNLDSFAKAYRVNEGRVVNCNDIGDVRGIDLAYIASNHASHTEYAIQFLRLGIDVYIEKPIAVSNEQLKSLKVALKESKSNIYFGYNRPFSAAIREIANKVSGTPITLTCTIIGHLISEDHWYRNQQEGSRVCGNLGHWIDLAIHLLIRSGGCSYLDITIVYSDLRYPDDNINVSFTTSRGDLISICLTSREEPFEGINETIVFQQKDLFVKIDDFRKAVFYEGEKRITRRYRPKDVGHESAIMQPFSGNHRDSDEVFFSTEVMLEVMKMVRTGETRSKYSFHGFS